MSQKNKTKNVIAGATALGILGSILVPTLSTAQDTNAQEAEKKGQSRLQIINKNTGKVDRQQDYVGNKILIRVNYDPGDGSGNTENARKIFAEEFADVNAGFVTESSTTTSKGRNGHNRSTNVKYSGPSFEGEAQTTVSEIPFVGDKKGDLKFTWKDAMLLNAKASYDMLGDVDRLDARALVSYLPKNKIFSAGLGVAVKNDFAQEELVDNYVAELKRTTFSPVVSAALYGRKTRVAAEARFGTGTQKETVTNSAMPGTFDSREVDVSATKYALEALAQLGLIDVKGKVSLENIETDSSKTSESAGTLGINVHPMKKYNDASVGLEFTLGNRTGYTNKNTSYQKLRGSVSYHF